MELRRRGRRGGVGREGVCGRSRFTQTSINSLWTWGTRATPPTCVGRRCDPLLLARWGGERARPGNPATLLRDVTLGHAGVPLRSFVSSRPRFSRLAVIAVFSRNTSGTLGTLVSWKSWQAKESYVKRVQFILQLMYEEKVKSQEWSTSNFPCSLTRYITSHSIWRTWLFIAYSDERWLCYQPRNSMLSLDTFRYVR